MRFTGADAYTYVVETSTNLADGLPVSTNRPANGSFLWLRAARRGETLRLYRAALAP